MRIAPRSLLPVLSLVSLVPLLTWLLLHSVGPRGRDYVWAQRDVARVSLGEATLRGDALQARIGLLPNYDSLVDDMRTLSTFVDQLSRQAMIRKEDAPLMSQLKARIREDDAALEHFKSDDALLQNSLTYFSVLDTRLATADLGEATTSAVSRLGSAMLELSRHPSPALGAAVDTDLDLLAAVAASNDGRIPSNDLTLLLMHGHLLAQLLPALDADLRTLFGVSTDELRDRIRKSQDDRRVREENLAGRYRLALYIASVVLLIVLTRVVLQRRAGLQLLRRHAQIETLLADISTVIHAKRPGDYDATIRQTLFQLGTAFAADSVHLLDFDHPEQLLSWCAPGAERPFVPTKILLDAVSGMAGNVDELTDTSLVRRATPSPLVDALLHAGIVGWYGIVLRVADRRQALLSFERVREDRNWPHGGTGLLRKAAEVVQVALDRRQVLIHRAELEARLSRAKRLEAVGVFASGIAHNFNNMIGAIMGHAEMAEEASREPLRAVHHINEVRRASERAQQLVSKILEFGSRRTTPMGVVEIDKLIRETVSLLRVTLPPHVELVGEPQATGELIHGDAIQLQQVLMNLIGNAAQAMPGAGTIMVQADPIRLTLPQPLSHETIPPGDYLRIGVSDTGSGMDAATLANVFEPFFTTRPAGTGLGLATVREIIHDHAGAVDVRTVEHRGSTFAIWLPAGRLSPHGLSKSRDGTGKTILLLAPSRSVVLNDEEMLAALGYEPVGFHDVDAAINAARSQPARFDAVLIDPLRLDAAGRALLCQFRDALPLIPLILVTAGPVTESPVELADLGVSLHTRRPLRSGVIAAALMDSVDTYGPGRE